MSTTYAAIYESGCLLNSLTLMRAPSGLGLCLGADQLACDTDFGLKPLSVGPEKEYFDAGGFGIQHLFSLKLS